MKKLGRLPRRHDARRLYLADYIPGAGFDTPPEVNWLTKIPQWFLFANDSIGDCTAAGLAHIIMLWTAWASTESVPPLAEILAAYSAITGYDPAQTDTNGNNPTDTGANLLDVLSYWRKTAISGITLVAYAAIQPCVRSEVKAAIALFGVAYIGVDLPQSAMDATNDGRPWQDCNDRDIIGGHCIILGAYDASGVIGVTWGQTQKISWSWLRTYCDEAYAPLSQAWLAEDGKSPSGLNTIQLQADLQMVTRHQAAPQPTP